MMLLNCDLGESYGNWINPIEKDVMPFIDMANIACGYHAGDPMVMLSTVQLAQQYQVDIGAHPSYPDLQGFGRRSMHCSSEEITAMLLYQLGALSGICQSQNTMLRYIKPHGALYNDMMKKPDVLNGIFTAIKLFDPSLPLIMMASTTNHFFEEQAERMGIKLLFEAFVDRAYDDEGYLVSRNINGAVLSHQPDIISQAQQLCERGSVKTMSGQLLKIEAQTLCIHGDNPTSVAAIRELNKLMSNVE